MIRLLAAALALAACATTSAPEPHPAAPTSTTADKIHKIAVRQAYPAFEPDEVTLNALNDQGTTEISEILTALGLNDRIEYVTYASMEQRAKEQPDTQNTELSLDGTIATITPGPFNAQSPATIKAKVAKALDQGAEHLIIDLRDHQGGLLDSAISIANFFVSGGPLGSYRSRERADPRIYIAELGDILDGKPIAVLINEKTATGAEFVALALRSRRDALLVGKTSFGEAGIKTVRPLGLEGDILLIRTGELLGPGGESWQGSGLTPDIESDDAATAARAALLR
ncbi:S41 family peptidase [Parvularcula lutaonensis]|uniref:S41 family peptidase n=1 Tax=Parvularcula lutaonensis TaxID=491923 RepID=A0ABV7MBM2_9PROT|nr:S41 family peptidase [Parvularcula lutaonensis]GGY36778.1 hypothetical protein GCM10007148_01200 [Parvularcula lutaonensis]